MGDSKSFLEWAIKEAQDKLIGYVTCDNCNGRGYIKIKNPIFPIDHCKRCNGIGKITWIQNIFK